MFTKIKNSVGAKLIIMVSVLVLVTALVSGITTLSVMSNSLEDSVTTEMTVLASDISARVEANMDIYFNYLDGLATNPHVFDFDADPVANKQYLANLAAVQGWSDLGYVNAAGDTLTADYQTYVNLSSRSYVADAMSGKHSVSAITQDPVYPENTIIMVAVPVYDSGDPSTGKVTGVVYAKMDSSFLSDITNSIKFGDTGYAYMVNSEGTVIAYMDQATVASGLNAIEQAKDDASFQPVADMLQEVLNNSSGCVSYTYNGSSVYVGYCDTTDFGWHVVVGASESELFEGRTHGMVVSLIVMCVMVIIAAVVFIIYTKSLTRLLRQISKADGQLTAGDLTMQLDADRNNNDEIAQIMVNTSELTGKMHDVMSDTKKALDEVLSSSKQIVDLTVQSAEASGSINQAVDDISQGSVSQAADVEKAASDIVSLSGAIDEIHQSVEQLTKLSDNADASEKASSEALTGLIESNISTTDAINEIASSVKKTNEAAEKISKAATAIAEIASQTNLLSLNASIEAARAGDAGRGFAVVATEIQSLSTQSNDTASEIQKIIGELLAVADESEKRMNDVLERVKVQQTKLEDTKSSSDMVSKSVADMSEGIKNISDSTAACVKVQKNVEEIITNLSAISEENAAGTEETTASVGELAHNIEHIANAADELGHMVEKLKTSVDFWKV